MVTKTETLEERAARVARESQEILAERERIATAAAERLAQHQTSVDAETLADYDRRALDEEVEQARRGVHQALDDMPVTKALTAYYVAQSKRSELTTRYLGALGRTGRDVSGAEVPIVSAYGDLMEHADRVAQDAAADWLDDERAAHETHRNNPEETR